MRDEGRYFIDRGLWKHPFFAKEPFTEREAWQWMIGEAAYRSYTRNVSGAVVELQRGQLCASVRYLAQAWQWSKSRVDRFLKRLKTETMIGTESETRSGTRPLIISICNYAKYQGEVEASGTEDGTTTGTEDGTLAGHSRDKRENNKNNKHTGTRAKRAPASAGRFEEFWSEYPRREGSNPRKTALQVYQQAVKSGADEQSIIDGAKRYRSDLRRRGQEGSRYVAQAVTWLRQSRWEDDLPPAGSSGNNPPPITPGVPQGAAEPVDWRKWMDGYIRLPPHSRVWYGPAGEPGYPGCEVPASIQREYGFTPIPWVRRSDGKQFGHEGEERLREASG